MDKIKNNSIVIGFWTRLLSDIIDAFFLGVFGILLSFPLKPIFNLFGEQGLWIGFVTTFIYSGVLQSKFSKGQSLAKRLLNIEVVKIDGTYLSLLKSFLRFTVIALIFYNSWIWLSLTSIFPIINNQISQIVFNTVVISLAAGNIILIALHPQKRGIHDYLAGSIVVKKGTFDEIKIQTLYSKQKIKNAFIACIAVVYITFIVIIGFGLILKFKSVDNQNDLSKLHREIIQKSKLDNLSINIIKDKMEIEGFLLQSEFDKDDVKTNERMKIVEIVKSSYTNIDQLKIIIRTGYNIGIYSQYYRENTKYYKRDLLIER